MRKAKIIVITAGSFQGKSLVALALAAKLKYSAVISTDTVRNILHVINPERKHLTTSSYTLPPKLFIQQVNEVSSLLLKLVDIYNSRGESFIIEGIHINDEFLNWAKHNNNILVMALNNQLTLEKRVIYKSITRKRLKLLDEKSEAGFIMTDSINEENVLDSAYIRRKERIQEIHQALINSVQDNNFKVISFTELNDAIKQAYTMAEVWCISQSNLPI
jgi:2-phosphoglycerate kinase